MKIEWLGHDGMRISGKEAIIYIDPYQITGGPKADIILVTHEHYDHCSPGDIEKVISDETVVIGPSSCKTPGNLESIAAGGKKKVKGIAIEALPAYNTNKKFHPKSAGGLGYLVTMDGETVYHAGDTDLIPEMSSIHCDVALLPVSGTYVMDAEEAAEAALKIQPKLAIPMHYGAGVAGTEDDAERFKELLQDSGIQVEIKQKTA